MTTLQDTIGRHPEWLIVIALGLLAVLALAVILVLRASVRHAKQGYALVVSLSHGRTRICFGGAIVVPIVSRADSIDLRISMVPFERRGREALQFRDGRLGEARVAFYLRVPPTSADIERVAASIGCDRARDMTTLRDLFSARFTEALKETAAEMSLDEAIRDRLQFADRLLAAIGADLGGYSLDDVAIDYLAEA